MQRHQRTSSGFTLTELMATVAVLGVIAAIVLPRLTSGDAMSKEAACETHQGNIEIQCELWRQNTGAWPAANLSNIGADLNYFPEGAPLCPLDGAAYAIDSTGRVIGHNH